MHNSLNGTLGTATEAPRATAPEFLTFRLGNEGYRLATLKVQGSQAMRRAPRSGGRRYPAAPGVWLRPHSTRHRAWKAGDSMPVLLDIGRLMTGADQALVARFVH